MVACGNTVSSRPRPMSTLTTSAPSTEVLEDALFSRLKYVCENFAYYWQDFHLPKLDPPVIYGLSFVC